MKASPLVLHDYYVAELTFSVNPEFASEQPTELCMDDLAVEQRLTPIEKQDRQWQIALQIRQQVVPGKNTPYAFALVIVGLVEVVEGCPEEKRKSLVEINGASMMFGAAREIIRAITSRGPFQQILLPSVSFYPNTGEVETNEEKQGAAAE